MRFHWTFVLVTAMEFVSLPEAKPVRTKAKPTADNDNEAAADEGSASPEFQLFCVFPLFATAFARRPPTRALPPLHFSCSAFSHSSPTATSPLEQELKTLKLLIY